MGVGSGVFPRFPAAASSRDRGPSAKTMAHTFGSSAGRKLLVRKRTCVSHLLRPAETPSTPLLPGEQRSHLLLISVRAASRIGHSCAEAPQQEDSLMPYEIVAVARTLCLLCVVLAAFELGEMSVSFTGTQLAWMVVIGFILALVVLSFELLRAIWTTAGRD
jgi:hypothetical protein